MYRTGYRVDPTSISLFPFGGREFMKCCRSSEHFALQLALKRGGKQYDDLALSFGCRRQ